VAQVLSNSQVQENAIMDRTSVYLSASMNTDLIFESKKSSESEVAQVLSNSQVQENAIMEKLKKIPSLSAAVKTDLGTLAMLKVVRSLDVKKNADAFTRVGVLSLDPDAKDVLGNMVRLKKQTEDYLKENSSSTKHVELLKELNAAIPELEAKLKEVGY
jgi:hypothetical protein